MLTWAAAERSKGMDRAERQGQVSQANKKGASNGCDLRLGGVDTIPLSFILTLAVGTDHI